MLWSTVESLGKDGLPRWDFSRLARIVALAEAHSLKVIVEWVGSNWGGAANSAPKYINDDTSGKYQKIMRADGSLAQGSKFSGGVYAWTNEAIVAKETAALAKLAEWIRANDPEHTIIMVALNIEFGIHQSVNTDRSYDAHFHDLYQAGGYTDPERFNQDTTQAYFQTITSAFHRVLPGYPLTTAT